MADKQPKSNQTEDPSNEPGPTEENPIIYYAEPEIDPPSRYSELSLANRLTTDGPPAKHGQGPMDADLAAAVERS